MSPDVGVLLQTRALLLKREPPRNMDSILAAAESLEACGYGSVWVGDSLLASPRPETVTTLAAIGARTRSIRIGSTILIGSLRHPASLAHQLATVDVISGGRLTVDVGYSSGPGLWKHEHELVEVETSSRHRRTREGIEVMRKRWGRARRTQTWDQRIMSPM